MNLIQLGSVPIEHDHHILEYGSNKSLMVSAPALQQVVETVGCGLLQRLLAVTGYYFLVKPILTFQWCEYQGYYFLVGDTAQALLMELAQSC